MIFFSIVIPVYNAGEYLERCLNSIVRQTFYDFEVLLIDDGSQDNSLDLCNRICSEDRRFQCIRQEHEGASAARNKGIEYAQGEYIIFVDSDDKISEKMLEELYKTISDGERLDLCYMSSHYTVTGEVCKKNTVFQVGEMPKKSYGISPGDFLEKIMQSDSSMPGSTWLIVSRREFLNRNHLRFNTQLAWSEDSDFSYRAFTRASAVKCCSFCGYYYYVGNPSSVSKKFSLEKADGRMDVYMKWSEFFMNNEEARKNYSEQSREKLVQQFLSEYCNTLNMCMEYGTSDERRHVYCRAKKERSLWGKCKNCQYREYVRFGARGGYIIRNIKKHVKRMLFREG